MKTASMRREFSFQGLKLPDPNPQMSVEDVRLPSCRIRMNHEVIRRVHDRQASLIDRLAIEADGWRLIVILQYFRVMLHLVDEREFYPVAFKLDSHAHFPAGIAAAHVLAPASHAPSRSRRSDLANYFLRFLR